VIDRILLHIARPDCEQSYEPWWEMTPKHTIHILPMILYPNPIVLTGHVTEELSTHVLGPVYVVNTWPLEHKNRDLQLRQYLHQQSWKYGWIFRQSVLGRQAQ